MPGLPHVELAPELVLLLVLPPLIYSAGVAMSWREFRFNLRPIALLAVGCVVFTTVAVAAVGHALLGLEWPVGFVLGAIVSPPDVVAPLAIARRLGLPRRLLVVLEGEGLANDATALDPLPLRGRRGQHRRLLRSGPRSGPSRDLRRRDRSTASRVGWAMLRVRRAARDPRVEITLSLVTPYLAFWVAGASRRLRRARDGGVRALRQLERLAADPAATRLQGIFFWDLFTYLIEGMVFLLTGLQARTLVGAHGHALRGEARRLDGCGLRRRDRRALRLGVPGVVSAALAHVAPPGATIRRRRGKRRSWSAFTGIRGIVSLAAALAVPLTTASGAPFPHRDLILFLTFGVIVVTLVGQGLRCRA